MVLRLFFLATLFFSTKSHSQLGPTFTYIYYSNGFDLSQSIFLNATITVSYEGRADSGKVIIVQKSEAKNISGIQINASPENVMIYDFKSDSMFLIEENSITAFRLKETELIETGKTQKCGNYNCKIYSYNDFELWFSEEIPSLVNLGVTNQKNAMGLYGIQHKKFGMIQLSELNINGNASPVQLPDLPKKNAPDQVTPLLQYSGL